MEPLIIHELRSYQSEDPQQRKWALEFLEFAETNPYCLLRTNLAGHFTASAIILNHTRDSIALVQHKKLKRWLQPGGHADGNSDMQAVARKEAIEETGVKELQLLSSGIFDLDKHLIPARPEAPEHWHFDLRYLFYTPLPQTLAPSNENSESRWFLLDEVARLVDDESVLRLVRKVASLRLSARI